MDFSAKELLKNVWQLSDELDDCATLIVGEKRALLYDTMIGIGDLKTYVRTITDLPITVVNSHGHMDHVGNNCQFEDVYISSLDKECFTTNLKYLDKYQETYSDAMENTYLSLTDTERYKDLTEGMVFDLGGITARAVSFPGHTPGGIGLVIPERRVVLVGDAISPQMCLFLYGTQSLKEYRETLDKAEALDVDYIIGGHFDILFSKKILEKFRECSCLPENKKGREYTHPIMHNFKGKFYVYEPINEETGLTIMIIIKE